MSVENDEHDAAFDAVYPLHVRRVSRRFWTPVAVARGAAALFGAAGVRRVLDVGAGSGKFVLAAAMAAPRVAFVGIEQRPGLVEVACRAREQLGVTNAELLTGDATQIPWGEFDGLYLFNPLAENTYLPAERIDDEVELTVRRFKRDKARIERELRRMRVGTALVTYHGSGTRIPACYELRRLEQAGTDWLRLWIKRSETDDGSHFVEGGGGAVRHLPAIAT